MWRDRKQREFERSGSSYSRDYKMGDLNGASQEI